MMCALRKQIWSMVLMIDEQHYSPHLKRIRELCTDDAAYQELLDLLPQLEAPSSDNLFHRLLDMNPQAVTITALDDGRYLKVNTAFKRLTGFTEHEIIDKSTIEFEAWNGATREEFVEHLRNAGIVTALPVHMRNKAGQILHVLITSELIEWEGQRCILTVVQDTTHVDAIRQQLRDSEARYRMVVENQSDLICHFLPDTTITFANLPYAASFGYKPEAILGKKILELLPDDRSDKISAYIQTLIEEGRPQTVEYDHLDFYGKVRWIRSIDRPIFNSERQVVEIQAVGRDITAWHEAQQALTASETRYRELIEQQTDFIHRRDRDHRLTFVNQPFATLFGKSPDELVGQFLPLLHITEEVNYSNALSADMDTIWSAQQQQTYEFTFMDTQGNQRWIQSTDRPIFNAEGQMVEIQAVGRDITALKDTQIALAQSEAQFQLIFENYPYGLLAILDRDMKYVRVEGPTEDILGITAEALIGTLFTDFAPPLVADVVASDLAQIIAGVIDQFEYEYRRDEQNIFMQVGAFRQNQAIVGLMVMVEDITERTENQQREVALAVERERVNLITNFVTTASHEFRTPLSIIGSSAYIAKRTDKPEKREQAATRIQEQIRNLNHLVEDLATIARLDSGETMTLQAVSVGTVVDLALAQTERIADEKAIQRVVDVSPDLFSIQGNARQLVQAMVEILENAILYTPPEGLVTIHASASSHYMNIVVLDTGIGMSEQERDQVFRRFFRADAARTTRGFGLGLSIAKAIINQHGGDIDVHSEPSMGTTIHVVLPQRPPI